MTYYTDKKSEIHTIIFSEKNVQITPYELVLKLGEQNKGYNDIFKLKFHDNGLFTLEVNNPHVKKYLHLNYENYKNPTELYNLSFYTSFKLNEDLLKILWNFISKDNNETGYEYFLATFNNTKRSYEYFLFMFSNIICSVEAYYILLGLHELLHGYYPNCIFDLNASASEPIVFTLDNSIISYQTFIPNTPKFKINIHQTTDPNIKEYVYESYRIKNNLNYFLFFPIEDLCVSSFCSKDEIKKIKQFILTSENEIKDIETTYHEFEKIYNMYEIDEKGEKYYDFHFPTMDIELKNKIRNHKFFYKLFILIYTTWNDSGIFDYKIDFVQLLKKKFPILFRKYETEILNKKYNTTGKVVNIENYAYAVPKRSISYDYMELDDRNDQVYLDTEGDEDKINGLVNKNICVNGLLHNDIKCNNDNLEKEKENEQSNLIDKSITQTIPVNSHIKQQEKQNKNTMNFASQFFQNDSENVDFSQLIVYTMFGLAVKNKNDEWVIENKKNGSLQTLGNDIQNIKIQVPVSTIPVYSIVVGMIFYNGGNIYKVQEIKKTTVTVLNFTESKIEILTRQTNLFGLSKYNCIFDFTDTKSSSEIEIFPGKKMDTNMLAYMTLMGNQNNNINNQPFNPMMQMMMMNSFYSGDSGENTNMFDFKSNPFLMMSMMQNGQNGINPMMLMLMNKEQSFDNMDPMMLMMLSQQNQNYYSNIPGEPSSIQSLGHCDKMPNVFYNNQSNPMMQMMMWQMLSKDESEINPMMLMMMNQGNNIDPMMFLMMQKTKNKSQTKGPDITPVD